MHPTPFTRSRRRMALLLGMIVAAGLFARPARAQGVVQADADAHISLSLRGADLAVDAAVAAGLFAARLWFEVQAGETPPPPPPPAPPCCYTPPPPPPPAPMVVLAPPELSPPPAPDPLRLGLAVSGLVQASGMDPGGSANAGFAAALQMRTSPHTLFGLEVQSLTADRRATTRSRRDELAGLMAGRLFPWDAPLAPYLELAGGMGRAAIDTEAVEVSASQLIARAGIGIELRLGPHLVLDGQAAQVHRFTLGHSAAAVAANDPAFIGEHERLNELRLGLGYRF